LEDFIDSFNFDQEVNGLDTIGYESGSLIVNEYNFGKVMCTFVLWNIGFLIICLVLQKYKETKIMKFFVENLSGFFMYTVYMRMIIEAFFFILINALSEIVVNAGDIQSGFSYFVAIVGLLACLSFPVFLLWHFLKYNKK